MRETETECRVKVTEVNPWVAEHVFPLWWKILVVFTGPILLPVRLLLMAVFILLSYLCARIASLGVTSSQPGRPLTSWRKFLQSVVFFKVRCLSLAMGVVVKRRGRQASTEEAPLLVAAPHSTLIDWMVFAWTRSSVVAKKELSEWPLVGVVGRLMQTVWVDRDSQEARDQTLQEIRRRSQEPGWPQLLVFPEGTNTNGQTLVMFRSGAFSTSKAVQPVSIRIRASNRVDTVTWTWVQEYKVGALLLLTLISPYTVMYLDFLPVIQPTEEEIVDPRVFANKVRKVLGEHLNLPCSEMSYKDAKLYEQSSKDRKSGEIQSEDSQEREMKTVTRYTSTTSVDFVGNLTFGI